MRDREAIIEAVRGCIGTPFRPQGRMPGLGLDCIGVAEVAARAAGIRVRAPADYALSGDPCDRIERFIAALGLEAVVPASAAPGDLILMATGETQKHLAVLTPQGFVHAHLALRRVVETPGQSPWPVIAAWRFNIRS